MHPFLTGLFYAVVAIVLAAVVIVPAFWIVNMFYDDGHGLTPLLIVTVAFWLALAMILRRRRISL